MSLLLQDYLQAAAARAPDKEALLCQDKRLTFAELDRASDTLARKLVLLGVQRGDRVFVLGDNTVETVIAFWAVAKASAVVSIVSPLTKAERLTRLLNDCQTACLIAEARLGSVYRDAVSRTPHLRSIVLIGTPAEADGALPVPVTNWAEALVCPGSGPPPRRCIDLDLAAIVYTSGSTGDPKGVMLTHRNMMTATASVVEYLEVCESDVILGVLPMSFTYGLYQMIMSFCVGARLVLERSFSFPMKVLELVVREGVTGFPGVPTMFAIMAELKTIRELDLSKLRYVTNAAAALPVKHITFLRELVPHARIYSMYGQTECKRISYLPPADVDRKPGSIGIAIPNTELWLVDEQDRRLPWGETGQLVVRGATVMQGYWGMPDATEQKLRPGPLPGERVLYTGDLCRMDDEGYLYFVSRMDDIIKSRGEKVPPKDVEHALLDIPGIAEAAVIGVPHDLLGQAVKAFLVLHPGVTLTERDVIKECQRRLEAFMVPSMVAFVPELPKTTSGKIQKRLLS